MTEEQKLKEARYAAGMSLEECRTIVDNYDMSILEQHEEYLTSITRKKNINGITAFIDGKQYEVGMDPVTDKMTIKK